MKKATVVEMDTVVEALRCHAIVRMQKRPKRWKFGTQNYGEVPGHLNRADGDCWDVFAPGYNRVLNTQRKYRCRDVIGVYLLDNGNHKIAIRLYIPGYNPHVAESEITRYCQQYTTNTGHTGMWMDFTSSPPSLPTGIQSFAFAHDQDAERLETARLASRRNRLLVSARATRVHASEMLDCCAESLEHVESESDHDL